MKRKLLLCLALVVSLTFLLASCGFTMDKRGIEQYESMITGNQLETTTYLLPSKDFITQFPYADADYRYYESSGAWSYEKSFACFHYADDVYQEAIEYVKRETVFLPDISFCFNGYTFLQADASTYYSALPPEFPEWFWMTFFSETRGIIGFIGYCRHSHKQEIRADEDFEGFIRYEFPYMDWDAERFTIISAE